MPRTKIKQLNFIIDSVGSIYTRQCTTFLFKIISNLIEVFKNFLIDQKLYLAIFFKMIFNIC
jgi:hypothetical protein